jgi:hypothetical protein
VGRVPSDPRKSTEATVTTIYLEPNLLALETPADAASQLEHLAEIGAELVVVAEEPQPEWDALRIPEIRYEPTAEGGGLGDWWLTADPDGCARRPARGVRSMLVGGAVDQSNGPTSRCDLRARDLRSAVLEILSRQAMPDREGVPAR